MYYFGDVSAGEQVGRGGRRGEGEDNDLGPLEGPATERSRWIWSRLWVCCSVVLSIDEKIMMPLEFCQYPVT